MTKPFNGKELAAKVSVFMKLYNLEADMKTIQSDLEEKFRSVLSSFSRASEWLTSE